jgi:hypothetical protein
MGLGTNCSPNAPRYYSERDPADYSAPDIRQSADAARGGYCDREVVIDNPQPERSIAMSPFELVAILALTGFAVYKQSKVSQVNGRDRFRLPIIYAAVGLVIGGFSMPHGIGALALLAASITLSIVVGFARGRLTRVWLDSDHRIYSRGTPLTIGLFLAMIAAKFGLGTIAYLAHIQEGAGFGEILVMIAVMLALQSEIVWRRARALFGAVQLPATVTA